MYYFWVNVLSITATKYSPLCNGPCKSVLTFSRGSKVMVSQGSRVSHLLSIHMDCSMYFLFHT